MVRWSHSTIAFTLLFGAISRAAAQAPTTPGMPVACTYRTCALRVEPVSFGRALVRGASGERVSRLGGFGGGVNVLLAGPDSAARHAHSYVHSSRRAGAFGLLSAVAIGIVLVRAGDWPDFPRSLETTDEVWIAVTAAGLGLTSALYGNKASRSLSRSVWWYNAELPR